jgi:hypothetical protein
VTEAIDNSQKPWAIGAIVLLVAIVLATAFFRPGDAPFLNDEPLLIHAALRANEVPGKFWGVSLPFTVAPMSVATTPRGLYYGPVATWFYQILLGITHNPIALVSLHALLLAGVTAFSLAWLARTMNVSVWLAVVTMLSPWLWIYHRMLWDNTYCIALSALMVAAYGDFVARGRPWSLRLSVTCGVILPLIHLMALPVVGAVAVEFLIFRRRDFWRYKWSLLGIFIFINALAWQYWQYILVFYEPVGAPALSAWRGWVFPFLGGRDLTAWSIEKLLGEDWYAHLGGGVMYVVAGAEIFSCLACVAVWVGRICAVLKLVQLRNPLGVKKELAWIAVGTLVFQCVLDGWQRVYGQSHYFNATWIVFVIFAWLAVDALQRRFWDRSVLVRMAVPVQAVAMLVVMVIMNFKIARDGGTLGLGYGTVLSEQIKAAKDVQFFEELGKERAIILVPQWKLFPGAIVTLEELLWPSGQGMISDLGPRQLIVRYRNEYPGDARFTVEMK